MKVASGSRRTRALRAIVKPAANAATAKPPARRADFGAPIGAFFEKQPPHLRAILVELHRMILETAPGAEASLKWGMPWFTLNGRMICSLGAHKAHLNLILMGPSTIFDDPGNVLSGASANGRHLKLTSLDELPRAAVRKWLRAAVKFARKD